MFQVTPAAQSAESFMKLQDIALQRIPSFKDATDIFAQEVEKVRIAKLDFCIIQQGISLGYLITHK